MIVLTSLLATTIVCLELANRANGKLIEPVWDNWAGLAEASTRADDMSCAPHEERKAA